MPNAALKPCRKTGCPALLESGYCAAHKSAGHEADRLYRGSAHSRGYDKAWQRVRDKALKRDHFLCQDCLKQDRVRVAIQVHHILKVTTHPHLRLNLANTISLCVECHNQYTSKGL